MSGQCPVCHASYTLIGRMHRCVSQPGSMAAQQPVADLADHGANNNHVANGEVTNSSTYRYRNPEARRAYMRNLMRRRRASTTTS